MTIELAREAAKRLMSQLRSEPAAELFEDRRGVVIRLGADALINALSMLKADPQVPFEMLADVTAVDWSAWKRETGLNPPEGRFSVYYVLYSIAARTRLFLEINIGEKQSPPSATPVYASANWAEREVYDMFGIRFSGHPDLRRILMPEDFNGHPLLKEFPTVGYDPQDFPQE